MTDVYRGGNSDRVTSSSCRPRNERGTVFAAPLS